MAPLMAPGSRILDLASNADFDHIIEITHQKLLLSCARMQVNNSELLGYSYPGGRLPKVAQ